MVTRAAALAAALAPVPLLALLQTAGVAARQQASRQRVDAGIAHSHQGRFGEAAEHFVRALALDPRNAEAHYLLGLVRHQQGRGGDARASFTAALKINARYGEAQARICELDTAHARASEAGYETALASCRRAALLSPRDPEPQFHVAWLRGRQGDHAGSIQALRAVLALDPAFPEARFPLAMAYVDAGNPVRAAPLLRQVVAAEPANGRAKFQLASVLAKQGDCASAVPLLENAPLGAQRHHLLAACLKKLGREQEAAREFAAAREAREGADARMQAQYRAAMAHRLAGQGKLDEAIAEYRAAIEHAPADTTLKVDLAVALLRKGDHAAVRTLLAGETAPLARYQLALAQDPAEALRTLDELVRAQPAFAEAWYQLGALRTAAGDLTGAEGALAAAVRLRPDAPNFRLAWAAALDRLGRPADAAGQRRLAGAAR